MCSIPESFVQRDKLVCIVQICSTKEYIKFFHETRGAMIPTKKHLDANKGDFNFSYFPKVKQVCENSRYDGLNAHPSTCHPHHQDSSQLT